MAPASSSVARLQLAAFVMVAAAIAGACGGSSGATPVTPGSGSGAGDPPAPADGAATTPDAGTGGGAAAEGSLCDLVTPADFARSGVEGAGSPEAVPDGYGGWYCVYAGVSGATGGIEFDIFPSADAAAAEEVFATATGEGPSGPPPTGSAFDQASYAVADGVAYLTVRDGPLVLAFSVPEFENSEPGLLSLAVAVAERASASG